MIALIYFLAGVFSALAAVAFLTRWPKDDWEIETTLFECWATSNREFDLPVVKNDNGEYIHPETRAAYKAWIKAFELNETVNGEVLQDLKDAAR